MTLDAVFKRTALRFCPFFLLSVASCLRLILGSDSRPVRVVSREDSFGIVVIGQCEPPISVSRTHFLFHEPLPVCSGPLPVRSSHRQIHVNVMGEIQFKL